MGPESALLWGIDDDDEPVIIQRPASLSTSFHEFLEMLSPTSLTYNITGTVYLEYFPIKALGKIINKDIINKNMKFSIFLMKRLNLLWMGGGNKRTIGSLHFDRHENLMVMIRGRKTFQFFDPSQVSRY